MRYLQLVLSQKAIMIAPKSISEAKAIVTPYTKFTPITTKDLLSKAFLNKL